MSEKNCGANRALIVSEIEKSRVIKEIAFNLADDKNRRN